MMTVLFFSVFWLQSIYIDPLVIRSSCRSLGCMYGIVMLLTISIEVEIDINKRILKQIHGYLKYINPNRHHHHHLGFSPEDSHCESPSS
jgi:hypothetical protein